MSENPRIEDLRRRVERDPASIAFAQLAEEYRRAGDREQAIKVCEAGLARHPAYVSARVTLGRSLLELGRLEEARVEFIRVLEAAPDNLIASSKLAEIHQQTRQASHLQAPAGDSHEPTSSGRVLAELHAWLVVLSERRRHLGPTSAG